MAFIIIIISIIGVLVWRMDRYFYSTIYNILEIKGLNSETTLNALGYYNKSIFTNWIYGAILILIVSVIIYVAYIFLKRKTNKELKGKIKGLEELLINVNKGYYSIEIKEDDKFSTLRDEVYKIIINLKSLEKESKRQKDNLKMDLANIAHQLKTPITSIGFMLELILTDDKNTDIYLDKLNSELNRLENFTEVLLKLSKVNSNAIDYKFEEISIKEILEDIINKLNRDKSIEVEYIGKDLYKIQG